MKKLLTITLLSLLSLNAIANDCQDMADKAYNAMLEYQYTGKVISKEFKEVEEVERVINGFDKKHASFEFAWKVFDQCEAGHTL